MSILDELKAIEERDGILNPQAVVDFARDPNTELHKKFEWENDVAGEQYRIWQARQLIRVQVTFLKNGNDAIPTNAFVSMKEDRNKAGGYRSIASILSDDELRARMLKQARHELNVFKRKYQDLVELASLFQEIEKVLK
jgi:hypothetical protein